jgi:hypothetical protein
MQHSWESEEFVARGLQRSRLHLKKGVGACCAQEHLKGKTVGRQPWRAGSKKRDELIADYRCARPLEPT